MQLDIYLTHEKEVQKNKNGVFIHENGRTIEITREEWDRRFPSREPYVVKGRGSEENHCVFSANITHNLGEMAKKVGLYQALWSPEDLGIKCAKDLIPFLAEGIGKLKSDPDYFRTFNPANGLGDYEGLVRFVEKTLHACRQYPDAKFTIWG